MRRRRFIKTAAGMSVVAGAGCTSSSETQETKEEILEYYNRGIELHNEADDYVRDGDDDLDAKDWESASSSFETAKGKLDEATDKFAHCVDLTYEIEEQDAREICKDAERRDTFLAAAVKDLKRAADEMIEGNSERANEYIDDAKPKLNKAREVELRDSSTLKDALEN